MARTINEIKDEEQPLGAPSAVSPDEESLGAEGFDVAAWVAGIKPTRRAVTVYSRPDLLADLDVLKGRLEVAEMSSDSEKIGEILQAGREITAKIKESSLDIVFEGWSQSRISEFEKSLEAKGVTDPEQVGLEKLAAQCVEPAGATTDLFAVIGEKLGSQALQVVQAYAQANNSGVDVDGPFWH